MSNFAFYFHDEHDPVKFESDLNWIKNRYRIISYKDLLGYLYEEKTLKDTCLLTVDDGWLSTYQVIFPIIKKHNLPLTIFVSPDVCENGWNFWYKDIKQLDSDLLKQFLILKGYFKKGIEKFPLEMILKEIPIEEVYSTIKQFKAQYLEADQNFERGFMNIAELREMHDSGLVEIGAHTMTHPILAKETDEKSKAEIYDSIEKLSDLLGKEITAFAYPNGLFGIDFGIREMKIVKSCGIKTAFSVNPGYIKQSTDPLNIPRIGSMGRLKLPFGVYLPSRAQQANIRKSIREFRN